ncbi:Pkinase-domain-containing protein [Xylariaceae sp. FL0594]|nr:Pkinase-domain-containing protein [Xylariaceae sp. FL0594]
MDPSDDSQATQQATQNALDPRRIGQQSLGFSDQEISDIICLLYPLSEPTSDEVRIIASSPQYRRHTTGRYTADAIESDLAREDDAKGFTGNSGMGDHALVLRLSSVLKNPSMGFTFGRNRERADICFANDPGRRLSNIHFRIYVNQHGTVLLEDQSTNGTVVDKKLLRKRETQRTGSLHPRRILESGSTIEIVMCEPKLDLIFLVRIPRREGDVEEAYLRNVAQYIQRANGGDSDLNKTIGPGPSGHVNLFGPARTTGLANAPNTAQKLQGPVNRLPREWRGSEKYARLGTIGKGAFATVHKVTSKFDGSPYAAKELDKRKFVKNGVLDQKVENEMKIMQRVHHPNIVQYIEHFDWDVHQFIIIMEYVPGGDLGKLVLDNGAIEETYVKVIADQLVDALGYLHENRITHRDVKPDNILIQSIQPLVVKLTDFGLSKMIDTEQTFLKTFCGTLLYCAPEVYTEYSSYDDQGRRTNRKNLRPVSKERYDHAVDIWSLGGVLFYTLTASPPFPVQNGITYTELLDHIIKTPVDITPLVNHDVSENGIHFLTRMIHVRPETRATIAELKSHPWLNERTESADAVDDALNHPASQLSLHDRESPQTEHDDDSSLGEPEPGFSMDLEHTFGQPRAPRLFGEVSAVGSSGVIAEERLNLPVSFDRLSETKPDSFEIRDSFEESDEFATPRAKAQISVLDPSQPDNSRSVLLGKGSQSLGGASSIFQNLNMQSLAGNDAEFPSSQKLDFTSSKRKTFYDTSDEHDAPDSSTKPSMKRLKSEGYVADLQQELELLVCIPKMVKSETGRQIDYPLPKTTYWDSQDESTWDLNYPEMTHLQYNAFETAAKNRKELFGRGKTPLWDLAMKYFPPTQDRPDGQRTTLVMRSQGSRREGSAGERGDGDLTATTPVSSVDSRTEHSGPSERGRSSVLPAPRVTGPLHTVVCTFKSGPQSLVSDILLSMDGPVLSWGRDPNNTIVHQPGTDVKVPKNAFRVMLWREGYKADELRPWEPARSGTVHALRESPEPDSYAFYIATKATKGIRINGNPLVPHDPQVAATTSPCKHWMKLFNGDRITFWGGEDVSSQAWLIFECSWGGSATARPADQPPTCVPSAVAHKLDRLWPKATKALRFSQIKEKAQREHGVRMQNMPEEEARSREFEQRRLEAIEILAQQGSSQLVRTSETAGNAQKEPSPYVLRPQPASKW